MPFRYYWEWFLFWVTGYPCWDCVRIRLIIAALLIIVAHFLLA